MEGLDEQRDVVDDDSSRVVVMRLGDALVDASMDGRVQDRLEVVASLGVTEDDGAEGRAVKCAGCIEHTVAEALGHCCQRRFAWLDHFARDAIGVEHHGAEFGETRCDGGLACRDATCKSNQSHQAIQPYSGDMLEIFTGSGLAAAAGMNAYIPLLMVGLANRFLPQFISVPDGWAWLSNPWVLGIIGVLLVVELVADKIPAVDSVNDVLQTVVRPASGGLVFGSSSGASTMAVTDPAEFFTTHQWVPIVIGIVIALGVHGLKTTARPVANAVTLGAAAPIMSTVEDFSSVALSVFALILPVLAILGVIAVIVLGVLLVRRRRRGRSDTPLTPATEQ